MNKKEENMHFLRFHSIYLALQLQLIKLLSTVFEQ